MITPNDIKDNATASGFKYVYRSNAKTEKGHGGGKPFQAMKGRENRFYGPRRATALEAAQDYCDYINSGQAPPQTPQLKSAGHKRSSQLPKRVPISEREKRLRKELRQVTEQRMKMDAKLSGSRGYIYLIGEKDSLQHEGGVRISTKGVKIGWAIDPEDRIRQLQTGNPRPLVILGLKPGSVEDEKKLHAKHIKANVLGEWFRPTPSLLSEFGQRVTIRGVGAVFVEEERGRESA